MDEDCLTLNVFAGRRCVFGLASCPVLLYIFGGTWVAGSPNLFSNELIVDNFASQGLIFITIQYRLGALAYFHTPNLVRDGVNGNNGILGKK
jgi:para-nitrobenzyl esterase